MHTREDLHEVVEVLYTVPEIRSILAFGSLVERGEGEIIRLVLEVDDHHARAFARFVTHSRMEFSDTYTRGKCALEYFGLHEREGYREFFFRVSAGLWQPRLLRYITVSYCKPLCLDLYVFPIGWRQQFKEIEDMWEIRNTLFLPTLARTGQLMPRTNLAA